MDGAAGRGRSRTVPIGAGKFGRVRARALRSRVPGDLDLDGIPDALDIDDDGDLILDTVDRSTVARAAQSEAPTFSLLPVLSLPLAATANANHPALAAQIDSALSTHGSLILGSGIPQAPCPQGAPVCAASTELDCAGDPAAVPPRPGLWVLQQGRYGKTLRDPRSRVTPECCDADNDGFGSFGAFGGSPTQPWGDERPDQTGNLLLERGSDAGGREVAAGHARRCPTSSPPCRRSSPTTTTDRGSAPTPLSYPYPPGIGIAPPSNPAPRGT